MKARRLSRRVYRRGDVLWIRFQNADGKLTRESEGPGVPRSLEGRGRPLGLVGERYDTNPVRAIHQFREPPGRDRFLSVEEFRLLIEECKDPELRTVILVLCMTTLRLRELPFS